MTETEKPTKERVVLASLLFLTLVILYLDRVNTSVMIADDSFLSAMQIKNDPVAMGALMSSFLLAYGASNAVLGPLGDVLGPRRMMITAIVIVVISMIVGGLAETMGVLLAARVILGLGEGMHYPMQMKFVKNWFPPLERGKANSAWQIGMFFAPAIAMPFFVWIIGLGGWRFSFFALAALSLIPLVFLYWHTTDRPDQHQRVNKLELEYVTAGLKAEADREAAMGAITTWQSYKMILCNYRFWLLTIYYMCSSAIFWGLIAWLPSYFKVSLGFSWASMGVLASVPYLLAVAAILVCGYLTDKYGKKVLLSLLSVLLPAVLIYLSSIVTTSTNAAICISLAVAGGAVGLPAMWSIQQRIVPGKALAAGAGLMNGLGMASSAVAPMVIGYLIKLSGNYSSGLMYLVALGIVGSLTILALGMALPDEKKEAQQIFQGISHNE